MCPSERSRDEAATTNTADSRTTYGNGKGLVDLKLARVTGFGGCHVGLEQIDKQLEKIQVFARHVGHLEDGTNPGTKRIKIKPRSDELVRYGWDDGKKSQTGLE
mgnify:CR=1 FL=1